MATITPRPGVPDYREKPLRIAAVQFDPKIREVRRNIKHIEDMLKDLQPGSADLIVLPEMALTGYMFESLADIEPLLEPARIGPTSLFCRALAQRTGAYVVAGYPERADPPLASGKGYNSAIVVSPTGEVVHNYRKTFLYETDKTWAAEGPGFSYIDLPAPLGRICVGICMDLNPKDFIAPFDAYELSTFAHDNAVDILVMPTNWLQAEEAAAEPSSSTSSQDPYESAEGPEDASFSTMNYWAHRLTPLHDPSPVFSSEPPVSSSVTDNDGIDQQLSSTIKGKKTVFVACNRTGTEKGTTFVGSSCVFELSPEPSKVEVLDCLGKREEMVLFVTLS